MSMIMSMNDKIRLQSLCNSQLWGTVQRVWGLVDDQNALFGHPNVIFNRFKACFNKDCVAWVMISANKRLVTVEKLQHAHHEVVVRTASGNHITNNDYFVIWKDCLVPPSNKLRMHLIERFKRTSDTAILCHDIPVPKVQVAREPAGHYVGPEGLL
jgi:hypothetical protein